MKSGKYNSIHVDNVDQKKIDSQIRGDTLIMGLDVAKKKEYAALTDETGKDICVLYWEHPLESRKFADFVDGLKPSTVHMVMEPTGSLWGPIEAFGLQERMGGVAYGTQAGARFKRDRGRCTQHSRRQSRPYPLVAARTGFDRKVAAQKRKPQKDQNPDPPVEPATKGLAEAAGVSGIGDGQLLAGDPPGLGVKEGYLVGYAY